MTTASIRRRYLVLIGLRWFQTGLLIPIFTLFMVDRGLTLVEIGWNGPRTSAGAAGLRSKVSK